MSNEKKIDELFKSFNPEVDTQRIMTEISGKMDVIDMVRPEQERMNRFRRIISVCCFIAGLLTGCFLMGLVLFHPVSDSTLFWTDHRDMILTLLAATSFILGSLPLINTNEWSKSL